MEIVMPEFGLFFWMLLSFSMVLFLLKKFAWKPILGAISERERSIENALSAAENARKEMLALQSSNESLIKQAMVEREKILKEAREIKDSMIEQAKQESRLEANRIIADTKESIQRERAAAIEEIKMIVSTFSIDIAEKILIEQLNQTEAQKRLINNQIENIKTLQ